MLLHYVEDFECCKDPQGTIKAPTVRYRVQVRPKKQCRPACPLAAENSGMIAGAIHSSVQTYSLRPLNKPSAGIKMCVT